MKEIESGKTVFVMFWSNVNSVSIHAFNLFAEASEISQEEFDGDPNLVFGAVACHEDVDVCNAFGISHPEQHKIFAYASGKRNASQVGLFRSARCSLGELARRGILCRMD